MPVAIISRMLSGVVIIDMRGRLCFLDVSLREHVNELLDEGHRAFVLNLADVTYVDSFGLGQLVSIWTSVRGTGGQLVLLRPTDLVASLFKITKLDSIFHISAEEGLAVGRAGSNISETVGRAVPVNPKRP